MNIHKIVCAEPFAFYAADKLGLKLLNLGDFSGEIRVYNSLCVAETFDCGTIAAHNVFKAMRLIISIPHFTMESMEIFKVFYDFGKSVFCKV